MNEFLQVIIALIAIALFVVVFYYFAKESSASTKSLESAEQSETNELGGLNEQISEQQSTLFIDAEPSNEETSRRKSDKIIPKRAVPHNIKITKESFAEFAGQRILVAEDNPINQKVLMGLLGGSGIEVVLANDGQEALDILQNDSNFLMILMDAHMPRIDGFEATRIIRANPRYNHIVVVALSGDIAADDIKKMRDAGMSEQLAKPLRMEALFAIIYAYAAQENEEKGSSEEAVPSLNIEMGLQTCGGDEDFYREILEEFLSDYGDSSDILGEMLRSNKLREADVLLLDIIGVTGNIGAYGLESIANQLKSALNDTDEQSYFGLFDHYKLQLERLKEEIHSYT